MICCYLEGNEFAQDKFAGHIQGLSCSKEQKFEKMEPWVTQIVIFCSVGTLSIISCAELTERSSLWPFTDRLTARTQNCQKTGHCPVPHYFLENKSFSRKSKTQSLLPWMSCTISKCFWEKLALHLSAKIICFFFTKSLVLLSCHDVLLSCVLETPESVAGGVLRTHH